MMTPEMGAIRSKSIKRSRLRPSGALGSVGVSGRISMISIAIRVGL